MVIQSILQRMVPSPTASSTLNGTNMMMPDRIFSPEQFEYDFQRVSDGLDFTCNHYYRKSQTLTYKDHIAEETLSHLAENGVYLV